MAAGSLVAAVVAAAAAGAAARGAARGAVTILVVAVAARGPRVVLEAVPIALVAGFAASRAAAGRNPLWVGINLEERVHSGWE
jgi:hypothetical protein